MNQSASVIEFSFAIIALVVIVSIIYVILERKKKKNIRKRFRKFSENHKAAKENLRAVPRVAVPGLLEVVLTLTDSEYYGLKARVLDMSLSGFSVKPDFPLKKLPLNTTVKNVLVITPINTFAIKEMKTVRIDHQVDKRLMAFHIENIDEHQFESLKQFMAYLDEFLRKKHEEETT
ncbi:MAG: PilZ domain-containing protein [Candidatus Aminicenantes bacterium]|nr:MAG: PilZ domain-containing protein [Candidatus Aminicenantes bacterium]